MASSELETSLFTRLEAMEARMNVQAKQINSIQNEVFMLRYCQRISTFPKFPLLPKELRNLIWLYALPGSCLVEVGFTSHGRDKTISFDESVIGEKLIYFRPVVARNRLFQAPAICFSCHEALDVARLAYDRCFAFQPPEIPFWGGMVRHGKFIRGFPDEKPRSSGVFFQPDYDTIYISNKSELPRPEFIQILSNIPSKFLHIGNIKSLAVHLDDINNPDLWNQEFSSFFKPINDTPTNNEHNLAVSPQPLPWLEKIRELYVVVYSEHSKSEEATLKTIRDRISRDFSPSNAPRIYKYTLGDLKELPRWERDPEEIGRSERDHFWEHSAYPRYQESYDPY